MATQFVNERGKELVIRQHAFKYSNETGGFATVYKYGNRSINVFWRLEYKVKGNEGIELFPVALMDYNFMFILNTEEDVDGLWDFTKKRTVFKVSEEKISKWKEMVKTYLMTGCEFTDLSTI